MEVGMVAIDGIPRQEVRFGQFVATLVEVGPHRHAARMAQMVRSHHVKWDDEGYFPGLSSILFLERLAAKGGPALHVVVVDSCHLLAPLACHAAGDIHLPCRVAFEVVVGAVFERLEEKLAATVLPYPSTVVIGHRGYTFLRHDIVEQDTVVDVGDPKLDGRFVGVLTRPVGVVERDEGNVELVECLRHQACA